MRIPFPPPLRLVAPLLALAFGLLATWFDYRLNLDLDRARHIADLHDQADSNGRRIGRLSERLLSSGNRDALQGDLEAIADLPGLTDAAVVDAEGLIIADSTGKLHGRSVQETPLVEAAALMELPGQTLVRPGDDEMSIASAHPFRIGENGTGWALLEFDGTAALLAARIDANTQLVWMACAMGLLSFALWAVLHFAVASRLARLTANVRALGEGKVNAPAFPDGDDEVGVLSNAFSTMAKRLREREAQQVRLEREVLEISESERRRIGHDLHDSLGQRLTAASMSTNALVAAMKAEASPLAERGEDIGRQLRETIAEVRSLSHGLAPVAMTDDGLAVALTALAENTIRSGAVRCVFDYPAPLRVEAEVAGQLYRIVQEAVNNALKHAECSEIRIGLERRGDALLLEVEDDGAGFDEAPDAEGIGFRVMRYRAKIIGGELEIGSAPAGGARILCRILSNK